MTIRNVIVILAALAISWLATKALIPLLLQGGLMDVPNVRSSHQVPTARGGGIGIIAGIFAGLLAAWLLGIPLISLELMVGAAIIAVVGLIDDHSGGLPASVRLAVQLIAAGIVVFGSGGLTSLPLPEPFNISLGILGVPLALLWLTAVTNIYNFLDGIDGFAAVQGAIVGLAIAFLGDGAFTAIGFSIAGACIGFAVLNWHPAKVFMGDVSSGTLGFLLAALPLQLEPSKRGSAVFAAAMCLWFFLSDGVFTILRRMTRGEKVWDPHRSHLYQRLVQTGLRHDQVVLPVMSGAALLAVLAVISRRTGATDARWIVLATAIASFFVYYYWTRSRERVSKTRSTDPGTVEKPL